ncbi:SprB repeat-containing protein, partial [Lutibacter agarilyticus]
MKKTTFFRIVTLMVLLFVTTISYSQSVDGDYCPGPGLSGDEYGDSLTVIPSSVGSGTCAIEQIWADIDTDAGAFKLAFKIGNGGNALFRIYLDTDFDETTGLLSDTFGGQTNAISGAEYILEIGALKGATTLYKVNLVDLTYSSVDLNGIIGATGNSTGCANKDDGEFIELYVPFDSIHYDICDPDNPGQINIAQYASVSGGSTTSSYCLGATLDFGVELSGVITPTDQDVCEGQDSGTLTIDLNSNTSTVDYWEYSSNGTNFIEISGTAGLVSIEPIDPLALGTHYYRASITNNGVCTSSFSSSVATITVTAITVNAYQDSPVSCSGGSDGVAIVTASGGTAPYTITPSVTGLSAGVHTFTIEDSKGCTSTATVTISDGDSTAPTIIAPAVFSIEGVSATDLNLTDFPARLPYSSSKYIVDPDDFKNVRGGDFTEVNLKEISYIDLFSGTCPITINRTWSIEDNCGNIATATQTINIEDTTDPVVANSSLPSTDIEGCDTGALAISYLPYKETETVITRQDIENILGEPIVEGNTLPIDGITYIDTSTGTCPIVVTRTYTVKDICNNSAIVSREFNINDTTPPTGTAPTGVVDVDVCSADAQTAYPFDAVAVAGSYSDNCSGAVTVNLTDTSLTPGNCGWTLVYTYEVVDSCGNKLEGEIITHTGKDQTAPTIVAPNDITINCTDDVSESSTGTPTGGDSCSGYGFSYEDVTTQTNDGSCTDYSYIITRTWKAKDDCDNEATAVQVITVEDKTPPTGTAPTGVVDVDVCSADAQTFYPFDAVAVAGSYSDNCSGVVTVNLTDTSLTPGNCGWTLVYTYEVVDSCGNKLEGEIITHTGKDQTAPTIVAPNDITINCTDDVSESSTGTPTGGDSCSGYGFSYEDVTTQTNDGSCTDYSYIITRTWKAKDDCDNEATAVQVITVEDKTAPTGTAPTGVVDVDVCSADAQTFYPFDAVAVAGSYSDNCSGVVTVNLTDTTQTGDVCGWTLVYTYEVVDSCGNKLEGETITHTGQDQTPPTITAPANVTVECTDSTLPADTGMATGLDTCGSVTITYSDVEVADCGNSKTITRTWKATDDCLNEATAVQTITVEDTTPPTITAPANVTVECTDSTLPTDTGMATGLDTCGSVTITYSDVEVADCGNSKTITRTWKATDDCLNEATAVQTITVEDTTPPTITAPANVTVECTDSTLPTDTGMATGLDTCGSVTITYSDVEVADCGNSKTITRTWKATDDCLNEATAVQTITVEDTTPPTITAPVNVTVECTDSTLPAATGMATGLDTCGSVTITYSDVEVADCGNSKTITRTWKATDDCLNEA